MGIYGFLYVYNRNEVSISHRFGYICETCIWSARGNYALNHVLLVHIVFQNKTKKKRKKFGGWTGIRTYALGTASAPNGALQTLTSQGQTPCPFTTIFKKFLGDTIADT